MRTSHPLALQDPFTQDNLICQHIKPVSIEENKQLDSQLVRLIAREYHPFSLVEDVEFRRFEEMCALDTRSLAGKH
jgi:hypothetical protein